MGAMPFCLLQEKRVWSRFSRIISSVSVFSMIVFKEVYFLLSIVNCQLSQLIQLIPASGFHLMVDFFSLVQKPIELLPVISPTPNLLSFQPPKEKGSRG